MYTPVVAEFNETWGDLIKKKSLFKRTFSFLALDSMSTMDPSGLSTLKKIKEAFEVYMYDLVFFGKYTKYTYPL